MDQRGTPLHRTTSGHGGQTEGGDSPSGRETGSGPERRPSAETGTERGDRAGSAHGNRTSGGKEGAATDRPGGRAGTRAGSGPERRAGDRALLTEVAQVYYVVGATMNAIALRLGVSRSTVSRMLNQARKQGIVRISITSEVGAPVELQRRLDPAGVRAHVVEVRAASSPLARLDAVARTAGHLVGDSVRDGTLLGLAWGTTIGAVVEHLPQRRLVGVTVVQLNGAASARSTGIPYAAEILGRAAEAFGGTARR